jgi:hypothetical protein
VQGSGLQIDCGKPVKRCFSLDTKIIARAFKKEEEKVPIEKPEV